MKLTIVLFALSLATMPAFAQDASSTSSSLPPATAPASTASAPQPAPPALSSSTGFTFAQVMGSLADVSTETAAITAIDKKSAVSFVEMHLLPGYTAAALTFTAAQSDALKALHKTMGRNNALMAKLRRAGYLLDDVVAVLTDPSGAPVVFIDL